MTGRGEGRDQSGSQGHSPSVVKGSVLVGQSVGCLGPPQPDVGACLCSLFCLLSALGPVQGRARLESPKRDQAPDTPEAVAAHESIMHVVEQVRQFAARGRSGSPSRGSGTGAAAQRRGGRDGHRASITCLAGLGRAAWMTQVTCLNSLVMTDPPLPLRRLGYGPARGGGVDRGRGHKDSELEGCRPKSARHRLRARQA